MSERQKVAEMTKTLVNMFPDSKNDLEKVKQKKIKKFLDKMRSVVLVIL